MYYTSREVYEYVANKTNDPIVEWKPCVCSWVKFAIYASDLEFYDKISPVFNGKKYGIPTPRLCPEERQRRRLLWRNERKLYKRTCDATGKTIISIYSPDKNFSVYSSKFWWSDQWDALTYGISYDVNKSFKQHMQQLLDLVPKLAIMNDNWVASENCEYCQDFAFGKNCYMCTWAWYLEDCMYCDTEVNYCKNLLDCSVINHSQHCYQCFSSTKLRNCFWVWNSSESSFCWFSHDIHGCDHCLLCTWLYNTSYHYKNAPISKEEYDNIVKEMQSNPTIYKEQYVKFMESHKVVLKSMYNIQSSNVYGNALYMSKNMIFSYETHDGLSSKYIYGCDASKSCFDITISGRPEMCYECVTPDEGFHNAFTVFTWKSNYCYYTENCHSCSSCFGCMWLRNKSYCIFNKQYTKDVYQQLVPKIIENMMQIGEWGELFDNEYSPFGYNETVAQDYCSLSRDEALKKWYKRQDESYDPVIPQGVQIFERDVMPTDSKAVDDSILKKILLCEVSWRPYRLLKQELQFYRKHALPIPRKHPDVRHAERLQHRPWRQLYARTCDKTWEEILSVYPQDVAFKVYGEEAYKKEVFG